MREVPNIALSLASFSFSSLAFYCKAQGMAALFVGEKCSHTGSHLRFSSPRALPLNEISNF